MALASTYVCVCISIAPLPVHYYSETLPTPDYSNNSLLCRSSHAEAPQAIASEGLAQGPYAAARVGFESATLRSQGTERTTAPPRPTCITARYNKP